MVAKPIVQADPEIRPAHDLLRADNREQIDCPCVSAADERIKLPRRGVTGEMKRGIRRYKAETDEVGCAARSVADFTAESDTLSNEYLTADGNL